MHNAALAGVLESSVSWNAELDSSFTAALIKAVTGAFERFNDGLLASFNDWEKIMLKYGREQMEIKAALSYASDRNQRLAHIYRHTKKLRTRRKYAKMILNAWRKPN